MAYFAQNGAMHGSYWSGTYVPAAPITRILCDMCAKAEVPFGETELPATLSQPAIIHRHQCRPWKWAPHFGAPCNKCSKPT